MAMLQITGSAVQAMRGVLAAVATPDDAAMRISSVSHDGIKWELVVGDRPHPGDRVVRGGDVAVLVDPNAAAALDDKVLDAHLEGGGVRFSVVRQAHRSPRRPG
jgi:iron-sulfur cluster assembly protein